MSFATADNTTIWKQVANEKDHAAKLMARIALGLFVACNVLAATAYSAHSNYSGMCSFVEEYNANASGGFSEDEITAALKADYCN